MNKKLELDYRLADISNDNLEKANELKKDMIHEISSSDLLSATLKAHMYIERELNLLLEYFFPEAQTLIKLKFASKLKLVYELKILDKELFDVINKLNDIRNNFAHELHFSKRNDIYKRLSDSLSKCINKYHKIEIREFEIKQGKLDEEEKYKILLARIWIQVVIFCSTKERRKKEYGDKLISEVKSDVEKIEYD
ncbi:hypothetical protein [Lysinibacillus xylanilyticus]|uniref:hypothetical protein n=1 Tax=Lysinibacillus xylanilyticus TaxID=582475 RepID=UPI0036D90E12